MANEILKTIKINVDSSEYKALEKSLAKMAEFEKKIKESGDNTREINIKKRLLAIDKELLEIKKGDSKLKGKDLEFQTKLLREERRKLQLQKEYNNEKKKEIGLERKAKLDEIKNKFKDNIDNYNREQQRKAWSGHEFDAGSLGQRYGNFKTGGLNLWYDMTKSKGDAEQASYDSQIYKNDEQIKAIREAKSLTTDANEIRELNKKEAELKNQGENLKDQKAKAQGNTNAQLSKINNYKAIAEGAAKIASQLGNIAKKLLKPFSDLVSATADVVKQMLDFKSGIATYNTSTSLITNSSAREQQMKYGLSSSQNYGFTQAKSMLGIETDEDLMYMNSAQREKFLEYMDRYSKWYDKMEASGVLDEVQEMQLEFQEFKQEIAMEFLQWVGENKEVIMTCLRGIFEFVKTITTVVMKIVEVITGGNYFSKGNAALSDISQSITNTKSTVINVNANTTNNATGIGSQEAMDEFNKENFNKLAKQIVGAIGG